MSSPAVDDTHWLIRDAGVFFVFAGIAVPLI